MRQFANRAAAGRSLAALLDQYRGRPDVLVLGLPRGGVPVAFEVARFLKAPLDVLIVRKLGAPGQPELAVGAIASGGITVVNERVLAWFKDTAALELVEAAERAELEQRERAYREGRPPPTIRQRTAILVDDGAATGASMLAAVRAARELGAAKVIVALPVASISAHQKLCKEADEVVCVNIPVSFYAVGQWYADFAQTADEEVPRLLTHATEWTRGTEPLTPQP